MKPRNPSWNVLYSITAVGLGLLWWIDSRPALSWRLPFELVLVTGIFGAMAGWVRYNRVALAYQEAPGYEVPQWRIEMKMPAAPDREPVVPSRLWYEVPARDSMTTPLETAPGFWSGGAREGSRSRVRVERGR